MLQLPWTVLLQHSHSWALIMLLLGAAESCATHSGGIRYRQSSFCPFDFIIGPAVCLLLINKYKHLYLAKLRWCLG